MPFVGAVLTCLANLQFSSYCWDISVTYPSKQVYKDTWSETRQAGSHFYSTHVPGQIEIFGWLTLPCMLHVTHSEEVIGERVIGT